MAKKKIIKEDGAINQSGQERSTVGEIYLDNLEKPLENVFIEDQTSEQLMDYEKNFYEAVDRGKKEFTGDFFIVVLTKKERLLDNIMRHYFITRKSCPTPEYDQAVYKFHTDIEQVEFLWVVPTAIICDAFLRFPFSVPKEEEELLKYVFAFKDGTLLKLAQKLNNENDSITSEKYNV